MVKEFYFSSHHGTFILWMGMGHGGISKFKHAHTNTNTPIWHGKWAHLVMYVCVVCGENDHDSSPTKRPTVRPNDDRMTKEGGMDGWMNRVDDNRQYE